MKFLITGANGFIGSNLAKKLLEANHKVRGLILQGTDESNLDELGDAVEKVYGDITDFNSIKPHLNGVDVVIHLAGLVTDWGPEKLFQKVNVEGSKNMLDASVEAGVKRFVFMSSLTVHGFKGFQNNDEITPYAPYNAYARSKLAVEELLNAYFQQGKIETVIVRPGFTIFGPKDRMFSFEVYSRIEKGKSFPVVKKGDVLMCYSYVENLVDGLILVGTHPKAAGQTYIISDGPFISFQEFLEKMYASCEHKLKLTSIPTPLAIAGAGILEVLYKLVRSKKGPLITLYRVKVIATDLAFTNEKVVHDLGYEAAVDLEEAFKRTYSWYKEECTKISEK
ncbi:MAG TPA: NAD-dependent epimerase/dehydratase family protein [Candidatus Deferrimicrobium sp.]|nr:NAD-dependent epimerase/dehydratase family protein [Candidatus Deferrimicrobium sp.]